MRPPRGTAVALAVLGLLIQGCARREVAVDLVAGLPLADVRMETGEVDLGAHTNRWHLGPGWVYQGFDRRRGVFAAGSSEAKLRFRATQPGDRTLQVTGRPIEGRGVVGATLTAHLNGVPLGRKRIRHRSETFTFSAPEALLRAGDNELTLRLEGRDESEPEMAWSGFTVFAGPGVPDSTPEVAGPRRSADGQGLILPAGTGLDYHLELPEEAMLEIGELTFGAAGPGRLRVTVEPDGEPVTLLAEVVEPSRGLTLDLAPFGSGVVRLSLEAAVPQPIGTPAADVILGSASITVPARSSPNAAPGDAVSQSSVQGAGTPQRNVLLYVVDALRPDHLGVYGYERDVSPNLDRFAEQATVFDAAIAQSSWTRAAMASVMTGLWPYAHDANGRADVLAVEARTLAELLAEEGYETVGLAQNANVFSDFGFDQGFETFLDMWETVAPTAIASVRHWLEERETDRPFFLWVHTIDPHSPYAAPGEHRRRYDDPEADLDVDIPPGRSRTQRMEEAERERVRRHILNRYDAEIYYADLFFGELLELLEDRQLLDETLLIYLSDHGEEFLDHGKWEHGNDLHVSSLEIPLVMRLPGQEVGTRVSGLVQQIDLLPTILDFTGVAEPAGLPGRTLMPLIGTGSEPADPASVFSYLHLDGRPWASVIDGDWKLMERYPADGMVVSQLFNRVEDPGERRNLVLERPVRARYLARQIEAQLARGRQLTTFEAEMDDQMVEALKALGYLD